MPGARMRAWAPSAGQRPAMVMAAHAARSSDGGEHAGREESAGTERAARKRAGRSGAYSSSSSSNG
eukprot:CAMPEP_0202864928 /NCGR_PEP_ID=MMETSP1391-20130828/4966_1 /ASSEMBLY_ACC=CAM_ASM_000867 /TAXON_ID=1034604 /ORGANISM="Chlamydomonas leiostraca, Strain SAG 11-49" /LENGTH=65 /DNA_ID=CAMNT_0049544705 /DNA_START=44 /DNA_END=238 /DNA_ORIENTATION=+